MRFGVEACLTDATVDVRTVATDIESAGLESMFVTQHTHVPITRRDLLSDPSHYADPRLLDPFVALGAAAGVTERITLGTATCLAAQYDTIILAKQVATLDLVSHGRFVFGVSAGWLTEEMANHQLDPSSRWKKLREQILAMKQIWTTDEAEFHGRFVDFDRIWQWPKPVQQPHPPVLIGGRAPKTLWRVVDHGDGWLPIVGPQTDIEREVDELHCLATEAGRPHPSVTACIWAIDEALIERCASAEVDRCLVWQIPDDPATFNIFLDRLSRVAERYTSWSER